MDYFDFKQFRVYQDKSAFKVGTDGVLLGAWVNTALSKRILDIGTGTGLIALMMAQRSEADIMAIEPDRHSYEQACENIERSPWKNKITVINTAVQEFSPDINFDLIVTNPPFFRNSLPNNNERMTLARHDTGLPSNELLKAVVRLLSNKGRFSLILPYTEAAMFVAEATDFELFCNEILKVKPLPSAPVKRMLMEFSGEKGEMHQSFITVESGKRHQYTAAYKKLTGDYYINF